MIKELILVDFVKHKNKVFNFTKGLNTITGLNETGKSLILEAFVFCLFGSQALRRDAKTYPNTLEAAATFIIRGEEYTVKRKLNNAWLYTVDNTLLAKSTTVVNQQINKLLGYGFDVFKVANMSSQDEIKYLSTLKPTERKKMIDKTLGLDSTKKVIENHKKELTSLNSSLKVIESFKPVKPEVDADTSEETLQKLKSVVVSNSRVLVSITQEKSIISEKLKQVNNLKNKIDTFVIPNVAVAVPDGITYELLEKLSQEQFDLNSLANKARSVYSDSCTALLTAESETKKLSTEIEKLKNVVGDYTEKKLQADLDHYSLAQTTKKLISQGGLTCKSCGVYNHLAEDHLKDIPEWVDVEFKKPTVSLRDLEKLNSLQKSLKHTQGLLEGSILENFNSAKDKKELAEKNLTDFETTNADILSKLDSYKSALKLIPERERAINQLELLKSQFAEMEKPDSTLIQQLDEKEIGVNKETTAVKELISQIEDYHRYLVDVDKYEKRVAETKSLIEKENKILETLNILLVSIRDEMLPKINVVATNWIKKLSEGSHYSVILDENMEILMDGIEVDAYSGSGKAIAHIALRLALAQVLTRGVFPVFLADEVDASMDEDRSPATLSAFKEMLNICTDQIIMISHRNLNLALDSDNAIEL